MPMSTTSAIPAEASVGPHGRLLLHELLGQGSFADVWRGQDDLREVAVKLCRPANAPVSSALDHARALARVDHPNISRVFYVSEAEDPSTKAMLPCVVMELIDGGTLEDRLEQDSPLTPDQAATIGREIVAGLEHIHERGLVHGDLHAQNVLLTASGTKLIDILYRGSLATASTASHAHRVLYDFQNLVVLLRQLLERAQVPAGLAGGFAADALAPGRTVASIGGLFQEAIVASRGPQGSPPVPADPQRTSEDAGLIAHVRELLDAKRVGEWNRVVRQARREFPAALLAWRSTAGVGSMATKEAWVAKVNEAVRALARPASLALAVAEAGGPVVHLARQTIEDLSAPAGWDRSGYTKITSITKTLIYTFHHALGAFLLDNGDRQSALELLNTAIASDREERPLWRSNGLMAWPDSLMVDDDGAIGTWFWLRDSFSRLPWVAEFFASEDSFRRALSAYCMLASLLELSVLAAEGTSTDVVLQKRQMDVPPVFLLGAGEGDGAIKALRMGVPDRAGLRLVTSLAGADEARVRELWPTWFKGWFAWIGSGRHRAGLHFLEREGPPKLP